MEKLHCKLVTPEGCLYDGPVWQVTVPGKNGCFSMRSGHAPILGSLDNATVEIALTEVNRLNYLITGGFVELSDNCCTIIVEKAQPG